MFHPSIGGGNGRSTSARIRLACPVLLAAAALGGCGSRDTLRLAPVAGTVTLGGKPLDQGQVVFTPRAGTPGPAAVGEIGANGEFRMRTVDRDGAAVGEHTVTVFCRRPGDAGNSNKHGGSDSLIPPKYGNVETSPLRFQVQERQNECPINLE